MPLFFHLPLLILVAAFQVENQQMAANMLPIAIADGCFRLQSSIPME